MIFKKTSLLLTTMCLSSSVFAANSYVSDELFTYTLNGPGTKYKILGRVHAGDKIDILTTSKGYTKIKDKRGRSVWINSNAVSHKTSLKEQLKELQTKYSKLEKKLLSEEEKSHKNKIELEKNLNLNTNKVLELKETNILLSKKLKETQIINKSINNKLDKERNELLMRWFSYGGIVAGVGLLLGLLIPTLIPSRKKKSSW